MVTVNYFQRRWRRRHRPTQSLYSTCISHQVTCRGPWCTHCEYYYLCISKPHRPSSQRVSYAPLLLPVAPFVAYHEQINFDKSGYTTCGTAGWQAGERERKKKRTPKRNGLDEHKYDVLVCGCGSTPLCSLYCVYYEYVDVASNRFNFELTLTVDQGN